LAGLINEQFQVINGNIFRIDSEYLEAEILQRQW